MCRRIGEYISLELFYYTMRLAFVLLDLGYAKVRRGAKLLGQGVDM